MKHIVTNIPRGKRVHLAIGELFEFLCNKCGNYGTFSLEEDISQQVIDMIYSSRHKEHDNLKIDFLYNENGFDKFEVTTINK